MIHLDVRLRATFLVKREMATDMVPQRRYMFALERLSLTIFRRQRDVFTEPDRKFFIFILLVIEKLTGKLGTIGLLPAPSFHLDT